MADREYGAKLTADPASFVAGASQAEQAQKRLNEELGRSGSTTKSAAEQSREFTGRMKEQEKQLLGNRDAVRALEQATGQLPPVVRNATLAAGAWGVAIIAVTAAIVANVKSHEDFERALGRTSVALVAQGRAGEITQQGLRDMANQLAALPGLSSASAQQTIDAFVHMRTIGGGALAELAAITADYAAATGQQAPKAAQALAKAFADPLKGARELDQELGILSVSQRITIEQLLAFGKTAEAQGLLLDALKARVKGLAEEGMTPLEKATSRLGAAWEHLKTSMRDSSAVEIAAGAATRLVNALAWMVEHEPDMQRLKFGPWGLPITLGQEAAGAITGAIPSGQGPTVSGSIISARGIPLAQEAESFKSAYALAQQYDTQGVRRANLLGAKSQFEMALGQPGHDARDYESIARALANVNGELEKLGQTQDKVSQRRSLFVVQQQLADEQRLAQERIKLQEYVDGEEQKALAEAERRRNFAFEHQRADEERLAAERLKLQAYVDAEKLDAIRVAEQAERDANWRSFQDQVSRMHDLQEQAKRNSDILAQSITDGIMRGFERGESFWENFQNSLRNAVLTVTLQPVVLGVSQAITAPIGALATQGTNALLGQVGMGSLFGGGAAALAPGVAEEAAALGISDLGAAGIGGGFSLGAALPWIGGGLLAAGALGLFDGDGLAQRSADVRGGLGGAFIGDTHWWSDREMGGATRAFFSQLNTGEQNLVRNLNLSPQQLAAVNSALGGISGRTYGAGQEHTPIEQSGFFQSIAADRLQAISSALGRSIEDLTQVMSLSAEQWQQAVDQLEQARDQAQSSLGALVRGLPGQLGITGLDSFLNSLATGSDVSPLDRLSSARSIYEGVLGRARSGDLSAISDLSGAASSYLGIGRDIYASSGDYQSIREQILGDVNQVRDNQLATQAEILKDIPTTMLQTSGDQIATLKAGFSEVVSKLSAVQLELQRMQAA